MSLLGSTDVETDLRTGGASTPLSRALMTSHVERLNPS